MYVLTETRSITNNNGTQLLTGFTNSSLMISLALNSGNSGVYELERPHNRNSPFKVRWVQGAAKGSLITLNYGDKELFFNVPFPLQPYSVELIPNRTQYQYVLNVYSKQLDAGTTAFASAYSIPVGLLNGVDPQIVDLLEIFALNFVKEPVLAFSPLAGGWGVHWLYPTLTVRRPNGSRLVTTPQYVQYMGASPNVFFTGGQDIDGIYRHQLPDYAPVLIPWPDYAEPPNTTWFP